MRVGYERFKQEKMIFLAIFIASCAIAYCIKMILDVNDEYFN